MSDLRSSRSRPSALQRLPGEVDRDVALALDQVISRASMTQTDALRTLNKGLVARGLSPASASAFSRLVRQFREQGIPQRYRIGTVEADEPWDSSDPLVGLIDRRIQTALQRRGL